MSNDLPTLAAVRTCACERPLLQERAVQKGAAQTVCVRCGLPVRLRFEHGR